MKWRKEIKWDEILKSDSNEKILFSQFSPIDSLKPRSSGAIGFGLHRQVTMHGTSGTAYAIIDGAFETRYKIDVYTFDAKTGDAVVELKGPIEPQEYHWCNNLPTVITKDDLPTWLQDEKNDPIT